MLAPYKLGPSSSCTTALVHPAVAALFLAATMPMYGCGGGSYSSSDPTSPSSPSTPVTPVSQSGSTQYDVALTSSAGHGTTSVYTAIRQTGPDLEGSTDTIVCTANDLSQCQGDDPSVSITVSGKERGGQVSITISIPSATGGNIVSLGGFATGTGLSGSYNDSLADTGLWTASPAVHRFGPPPGVYHYTGTFNSTANPLMISPTIAVELGADLSGNLTGTATITNSPCIASLSLAGHARGDALSVTDAANKVHILALPADPSSLTDNNFNFSYKFDASAPSCAGDSGRGVLTVDPSQFDY